MNEIVYILGIVLQAVAGIIALSQVRRAPYRLPWLLIAISSLLIVFRRSATLSEFLQAERELASAEVLTLVISFLFFLGVVLMSRMFRDVAKKQAALQESEKHFRLLADNAPEAIFIQTEFRFAYLNHACLNHFGAHSEEDLIGKPVIDRFHPDVQPIVRERIHLLNEEGQAVEQMEQKHIRLDGEIINAEVSAVPFRFKGQNGALVFVRNITERKQMERVLHESEEKFRTMAEFTEDWEYWQAPDGSFVYISPSCEMITGYPADAFIRDPKLMMQITLPDDRESLACYNFKQYQPIDGVHAGADLRIITRTQEIRWIAHQCQAVYSRDDGRFLGRRGSNRDITERKLAEAEINKLNRQLQAANAEKDKLFTIIAHDLKSPMYAVLTGMEMQTKPENSSPEKDRTRLILMLNSVKDTYSLLEDLLQWARMSQGGINYMPAPCDLSELVELSISTIQDEAERKDMAIRLDIPQDVTVLIDQPMIKSVFRNILFNAVKFTPRGGEIVITARQQGPLVILTVRDNGMGMDGQILATLFSIETTRRLGTEGETGTGLGLVLCKQFIETHGGQIWVESEPDKGTTVFFTLPDFFERRTRVFTCPNPPSPPKSPGPSSV